MMVGDLQLSLRSRSGANAEAADELRDLADALDRFADWSFADFAGFLRRCPAPDYSNDAEDPTDGTLDLSERETEVAKLIARGYSHKQIAAGMQVSVKTVETYKARLMRKLGLRSRVDLVQHAYERGWLATEPVAARDRAG